MIGKRTMWALFVAGALGTTALVTFAEDEATTITAEAETMGNAKTDMEMLGRFVLLEPVPETVIWETVTLPGGSDWTLTALMTYTSDDRANLLEDMGQQPGRFAFAAPDWLPDDVAAALEVSDDQITSDQTLTPTPFFKSPLLSGNALPIGDAQLLILLQTQ